MSDNKKLAARNPKQVYRGNGVIADEAVTGSNESPPKLVVYSGNGVVQDEMGAEFPKERAYPNDAAGPCAGTGVVVDEERNPQQTTRVLGGGCCGR